MFALLSLSSSGLVLKIVDWSIRLRTGVYLVVRAGKSVSGFSRHEAAANSLERLCVEGKDNGMQISGCLYVKEQRT